MSSWKKVVAALWFVTAAAFAFLARASVLIPAGEPLHSYYVHKAQLAALEVLAVGAAPMMLLILADVLSRKLAR